MDKAPLLLASMDRKGNQTHNSRHQALQLSAMKALLITFHVFALSHYIFTLWYVVNKLQLPINDEALQFGGPFRFLTNWDVLVQTIFFALCIFNDTFGSNDVSPKKPNFIRRLKDEIHAILGLPLSAFVFLTFWGLYLIDRELIFPSRLDGIFPVWLNHCMHTNVFIFSLFELTLAPRDYPKRSVGLLKAGAFLTLYLVWTLFIYGVTGRWVYPVMEVLNWPLRICFVLGLLGILLVLYIAGEYANRSIWGKKQKKVTTKNFKGSKNLKKKPKKNN